MCVYDIIAEGKASGWRPIDEEAVDWRWGLPMRLEWTMLQQQRKRAALCGDGDDFIKAEIKFINAEHLMHGLLRSIEIQHIIVRFYGRKIT